MKCLSSNLSVKHRQVQKKLSISSYLAGAASAWARRNAKVTDLKNREPLCIFNSDFYTGPETVTLGSPFGLAVRHGVWIRTLLVRSNFRSLFVFFFFFAELQKGQKIGLFPGFQIEKNFFPSSPCREVFQQTIHC